MATVSKQRERVGAAIELAKFSNPRMRFAWEARRAFVQEYCPLGALALDVGCANGEWALPLATQAVEVDALDIFPEPLKELQHSAQEAGLRNIRTVCSSLPQWASEVQGRYEFCLCMGMLMLVTKKERIELLGSLNRVMKEGGVVFLDFYTPRYFAYRFLIQRLSVSKKFLSLGSFARRVFTGDLLTSTVFESEAKQAGFQVSSLKDLSNQATSAYSIARAIEQNCFSTVLGPYFQTYLLKKEG